MKSQLYLTALFFFIHLGVFSQTLISGKVLDEKNLPLPGVNVFIKGSYDGATSDQEGYFEFETEEAGDKTLVYQFLGFKSQELPIKCESDPIQTENVSLTELITEMNAVTISAGAMQASDASKAVVLKPLDIVTTPSAMGDIIGAFQTLPGTSTVGNDGRLFVRGGDASEVGIYIDGLRVGNAYGSTAGNVPTRTRFNPNLFKGTFFSTGGYSAEYGQALSSALALNTKDISPRSQGDLSVLSLGGGYSHTLSSDKQSITMSANFFDLDPYQDLVKQNIDWERGPHSWDLEVSTQKKLAKGGLLKVMARTESGGMELWQKQPGKEGRGVFIDLKNKYTFAQTNWKKAYDNGWTLFSGIAYSSNQDDTFYDSVNFQTSSKLIHAKFTGIKDFNDRISANSGIEYFQNDYSEGISEANMERDYVDNQIYAFSEWDFYLSKKLVFRGGFRAGSSSLNQEYWVDPRASFAYQVSENAQISLAGGTFSQAPTENLRVLNQKLENVESKHLILNYLYGNNGRTIRAEAFYKSYEGLVTFEGQPMNPINPINEGNGFAKGFDVFYRDSRSIKNTDFWVTYSFVDSERQFDQYSTQVQPAFAPKHNFSVVAKHMFQNLKSQLGMSYSMNDGYAYTDPNQPGEMNSKTKAFENLSLSWSYLPKPNLIIHFAVSNVLGRENVFGYQYSQTPNPSGVFESLPSGQAAPRFILLGVFLTLSKDKTANNLNNL
ncbi:TonB-dependent receptor [Algoriphagus machipongonensis]|uniref:TonB-dependent receptor n=1 Tax=Algoriphagus machipongonensis TaxID=388413 RepID=A3HUX6_9BACT|nr:TonB-dependent receptor [Algoriphagus machipongonensis]EAZ81948.1 TonB-dependent receptor [Algoriphagus machipongonensis]